MPSPGSDRHRNFDGNVTFAYFIQDGFGTSSATVTLLVPNPGLPPQTTTHFAPYNLDYTSPQSILSGVTSPRPNPSFRLLGLLSEPDPEVGKVTICPNGTFTFSPASGWFGITKFCAERGDRRLRQHDSVRQHRGTRAVAASSRQAATGMQACTTHRWCWPCPRAS